MESLPLDTPKKDLPPELVRFLQKVVAKVGFGPGDQPSPRLSRYRDLVNRVRGDGLTMADVIRLVADLDSQAINNPTYEATVPLVLKHPNGNMELVGSGVLVNVTGSIFLLTAAHVLDFDKGDCRLCTPSRDGGFVTLAGYSAGMRLPESGKREDDKWDVAYYSLDPECAKDLHPDFVPLDRRWVTMDPPGVRLEYSFAGYPWRRSTVKSNVVETSFLTFTGIEAKEDDYEALGLNRKEHITIRFNRERCYSMVNGKQLVASLPHGISGGGVYAWTESAPLLLPLAGIAQRFIPHRRLLIATRLHVLISCIAHQFPHLFQTAIET